MPFFPNPFQPARRPYSPEDRPTTRRGLARLVLRDHFFDLPPLNLLLAAVYAPALLWAVTGFFYILEAMGDDGGFQDLISLSKTSVLVFIPLGTLTGPAAGGMAAVTRDLARDRSRLPWFTFRTAVRSCWKRALVLSAATSLFPLLLWAALAFYVPSLGRLAAVPVGLTAALALLWLLALPTLYAMLVSYQGSLGTHVKTALALTLRHLPAVAGVRLLTCLPVLTALPAFWIGGRFLSAMLLVLCVYYLLFGFALSRLLWAFTANWLFESELAPCLQGGPAALEEG